MNRQKHQRGAALIEFALALPFALTLFVGIADFSVYFWRQTEMEEVARFTTTRISPVAAGYLAADETALRRYGQTLETEARSTFGRKQLTISLARQYACPLANGGEEEPSNQMQGCQSERVYLRVTGDVPIEPLLRPLVAIGYPKTAFWRHVVRLQ